MVANKHKEQPPMINSACHRHTCCGTSPFPTSYELPATYYYITPPLRQSQDTSIVAFSPLYKISRPIREPTPAQHGELRWSTQLACERHSYHRYFHFHASPLFPRPVGRLRRAGSSWPPQLPPDYRHPVRERCRHIHHEAAAYSPERSTPKYRP